MTRAYPHPTPATETEVPFGVLLCTGCDAIRDTERAFCADCGEATASYGFTPTDWDGEIVPDWYARATDMGCARSAVGMGFVREAHTGLVHLGEAA